MRPAAAATALLLAAPCDGHGQLNYPPSTRQGLAGKTWPGALSGQGAGGYCEQPDPMSPPNPLNGACMMFSQPNAKQPLAAIIPGEPTNNDPRARTVNVNVSSGPGDWTRKMPWRAPGSAPVLGSGCGVAGGGDVYNHNGGWPPTGMAQGQDPMAVLPKAARPTVWKAGSTVEVAWGVWANHGGGYSYRLCRAVPGELPTEACFQATPLRFAGGTQWLRHVNGSRFEIPLVKVAEGTTPAGSEWARIPIPECAAGGNPAGHGFTDSCTEFWFPEPLPGLHGFGYNNVSSKGDAYHDYSILDKVVIPDLPDGEYYLSWRWDCEQTTQIWQNCADIYIGTPPPTPPPTPVAPSPPPAAPVCRMPGIWLNPGNGVSVNVTQRTGATWAAACIGGKGWADGTGAVTAPTAAAPQGGATLYVASTGARTAGVFSTYAHDGSPRCSQISWDDGNTWCLQPFCSSWQEVLKV